MCVCVSVCVSFSFTSSLGALFFVACHFHELKQREATVHNVIHSRSMPLVCLVVCREGASVGVDVNGLGRTTRNAMGIKGQGAEGT